jgi:hypothetical protein
MNNGEYGADTRHNVNVTVVQKSLITFMLRLSSETTLATKWRNDFNTFSEMYVDIDVHKKSFCIRNSYNIDHWVSFSFLVL